jgi:hypothetical protein
MADDGRFRLDRLLSSRGALPPEMVLELGIRICDAADEAWRQDLADPEGLERDLHPSTIHLRSDGEIPIVDFGLSDMTQVEGDPSAVYRSPEALEGFGGTRAADVFVLGAILYEMTSGQPLFAGRRAASGDSLTKGLERRLKAVGIPDALDEQVNGLGKVLDRALRLDHAERWPDPGVLGQALRKVQQHSGFYATDAAEFLASDPAALVPDEPELPELPDLPDLPEPPPPPPTPEPPPFGIELSMADDGPADEPVDFGDDKLSAYSIDEVLIDKAEESAKIDPWAEDLDDEESIRARMSHRRLTPVDADPARKTVKKDEPTFGKAVRWFLKRVVLAILAVLLLALAVAWLGVFPGGTERQVTRAWEAIPEGARDVVPEGWVTGLQAWWVDRPAKDVGRGFGAWLLGVMPEDWAQEMAEEAPTPIPTPGDPTVEGVVVRAEGWISMEEGLPEGEGKVSFGVELGGRARGEKVRLVARPAAATVAVAAVADDDDSAASDATPPAEPNTAPPAAAARGDEEMLLPDGFYDLELTYRESEYTEEYTGWIRGIRAAGNHATHFSVTMEAPIGFVKASFERDDDDVTERVKLQGWPEPVDEAPVGDPTFVADAGAMFAVPAGRYRIKASVHDEGRAPAISWFEEVRVEVGERIQVRKTDMGLGELLDPTGPGIRIAAENHGRDVADRSQVLVFPTGADPSTAVAVAKGPAAYYFDVPTGTWDVQVVYQPNPADPQFRAEKLLAGVVVAEGAVVRQTVQMELPVAELKVRVRTEDEDLSEGLRVVVIKAGASFEGATRALDGDGAGPHPVAPGTWDIYLLHDEQKLEGVFRDVELSSGQRWQKGLLTTDPLWKP